MNFNKARLKQARAGIKELINVDPEIITFYRKPLIDDGYKGTVEDPYGTPEPVSYKVRLSHEKKLDTYKPAAGGLSTNLARFLTSDYESELYVNDVFTTSWGKQYKLGPVDPLIQFEGVIGYQYPLIEAVNIGGDT